MSFNIQFANLEPSVQDKFIAIARKDPEGRSAAEWFEHLVPESLQDSSQETEVFMDGGTVTQEVWVPDQGRGSGHWDTVEHTIDDRDVSRIEAGANGGEYTHDNTIMEDSSTNRSRGGEDMTETEYADAVEANSVDAELIDGAYTPQYELAEGTELTTQSLEAGPELIGETLGTVSETLIAGYAGYKVGEYVHKNLPEHWSSTDKLLVSAGPTLGTTLLAFTPPGQFAIGCYAVWKITKLGFKFVSKLA